jgi:hypothetical protein
MRKTEITVIYIFTKENVFAGWLSTLHGTVTSHKSLRTRQLQNRSIEGESLLPSHTHRHARPHTHDTHLKIIVNLEGVKEIRFMTGESINKKKSLLICHENRL